jgi:hypothetical protein
MPLLIRPVKMNRSIYVRVPNDIAHIIGLDNQVEVSFSFEDIGNELRLIYSLNKSTNTIQQSTKPMVGGSPVIVNQVSSQAEGADPRRGEHGTKVEAQGVAQG